VGPVPGASVVRPLPLGRRAELFPSPEAPPPTRENRRADQTSRDARLSRVHRSSPPPAPAVALEALLLSDSLPAAFASPLLFSLLSRVGAHCPSPSPPCFFWAAPRS